MVNFNQNLLIMWVGIGVVSYFAGGLFAFVLGLIGVVATVRILKIKW